jgi:D-proline reductase (dithiol) PrdB
MSAPTEPVRYIDRSHAWYGALGYAPYRYAHFADVPFSPLRRPLAGLRVALLTTAAPYRPELGAQGAGAPYNAAAKFYRPYVLDSRIDHDLRVSHVAVDRDQITDDSGTWFPLPALRRAAQRGRVGSIAPMVIGVPTNRSQRHTLQVDAPEVLALCRADGVEAALLVPNCPVCHQTMSLLARELEAAGIATVILGAAKDIVEHAGVPRLLFSDLPLGHAAGLPHDPASQDVTLELGLRVLEAAPAARTTLQSPLRWPGGDAWREAYLNPARLTAAELQAARAAHEQSLATARSLRQP